MARATDRATDRSGAGSAPSDPAAKCGTGARHAVRGGLAEARTGTVAAAPATGAGSERADSGIDVGAKDDVVTSVRTQREQRIGIVVVSTEPETVLALAFETLPVLA